MISYGGKRAEEAAKMQTKNCTINFRSALTLEDVLVPLFYFFFNFGLVILQKGISNIRAHFHLYFIYYKY